MACSFGKLRQDCVRLLPLTKFSHQEKGKTIYSFEIPCLWQSTSKFLSSQGKTVPILLLLRTHSGTFLCNVHIHVIGAVNQRL